METSVADPRANVDKILKLCDGASASDIVLFPELCITGYTCGDLFHQTKLLDAAVVELNRLVLASKGRDQLWLVGLPIRMDDRLFNTAAIVHDGRLLGIVPKQFLPTYLEFYERRWFASGRDYRNRMIDLPGLGSIPFGIDLLFECGHAVVGVEICEDLWMPIPPSSTQALAGANVLLNLSASNETVGKSAYRRSLVAGQSGRCIAAYAYAGSGPTESTTDLVFGGHCLIAEYGTVLAESNAFSSTAPSTVTIEVDLEKLSHDRRMTGTFYEAGSSQLNAEYRRIPFALACGHNKLVRGYSGCPFVPQSTHDLETRCREIFDIQCAGLAKRIQMISKSTPLTIGVSGGLDSTLALLVAVAMCDRLQLDRKRIHGLTMPGFGTSQKTLQNSRQLMTELGISSLESDIRPACLQVFRDLHHRPFGIDVDGKSLQEFQTAIEKLPSEHQSDLVFENVQARIRTLKLMSAGFVLGTGDLSEQALGWSTYNGDHMSMYNVNTSIPKTLVRFLVRYVAEYRFEGSLRKVLLDIAETPISPELLPLSKTGEIRQSTESTIGPYELHDFFLYHFIRSGASPEKILFLADHAKFSKRFELHEIEESLRTFLRRFFHNQFKRSCVPDGPKVGSVSLSPRGDWRMPSDASVQAWLDW
jgi:NAD+ synthase (glutamine-hydrolysing)